MSNATSRDQYMQTCKLCSCLPLFPVPPASSPADVESAEQKHFVPVAPELSASLQAAMVEHFPRATPFSILLLHITQFETIALSTAPKRLRCHAEASLLEQILQTVRRALRTGDQILVDERGSGAVLLFPQVDQEGMVRLVGRIAYSMELLQAETVIPPLHAETEIALGSGSYPMPAGSLDELFVRASQIQESIVFRPAVLPQPTQTHLRATMKARTVQNQRDPNIGAFPFMQIPSHLPTRLQQLIPYTLALELCCAPVGRDHQRLTVAMADPTNTQAIVQLHAATGMTISPVACEIAALDTLLASGW